MNTELVLVNRPSEMDAFNFRDRVYELVAKIPLGRVATYGDIALLCGSPRGARIVGSVAHFGPTGLPWQRVVNRYGGLASGYWGGRQQQKHDLEAEGVTVTEDFIVKEFERLRWTPSR
jgi:methylated-DNA-protein-cysteine methyltransferase-like protein